MIFTGDSVGDGVGNEGANSTGRPPQGGAKRLFITGPVLGNENGEDRRHACFKDSEEDSVDAKRCETCRECRRGSSQAPEENHDTKVSAAREN